MQLTDIVLGNKYYIYDPSKFLFYKYNLQEGERAGTINEQGEYVVGDIFTQEAKDFDASMLTEIVAGAVKKQLMPDGVAIDVVCYGIKDGEATDKEEQYGVQYLYVSIEDALADKDARVAEMIELNKQYNTKIGNHLGIYGAEEFIKYIDKIVDDTKRFSDKTDEEIIAEYRNAASKGIEEKLAEKESLLSQISLLKTK